jgi:hypothetical protein
VAELKALAVEVVASDEQVERVVRKVLAKVLPAALAGASVGIMQAIRVEFGVESLSGDPGDAVRAELEARGDELIGVVSAAMKLSGDEGVEDVDG